MTLQQYYEYHAGNRKECKAIEEYKNPPLFWCDYFHIHDENGNFLSTIDGRDMTNKQFEQFKDYEELKPEFCGGDYMHHHYLRPQGGGYANEQQQ